MGNPAYVDSSRNASVDASSVSVRNVDMDYNGLLAVDDASFELQQGKFLTILGPSGSGKTTLLRLIAGFQAPTRGEIFINGQPVNALPANKRSIGMVFQKLALFPHLTAAENVAFPLKMRRFDARTIPERVERFMNLVQLQGFGERRIHELSGGQQQRVAIARALVFEPDILLLDEPLAALDRKLREEMQLEFRRIQKELGVTTINVTHDQREALVVSDEIILMNHGKIQQNAVPTQMYRSPANDFVANFIGVTNFVEGKLQSATDETATFQTENLTLQGSLSHQNVIPTVNQAVRGAVRGEQIRIAKDSDALVHLDTVLEGIVTDSIFEGERLLYEVRMPALQDDLLRIYHHDPNNLIQYAPGDAVHIGWSSRDMLVFPTSTMN
ncbi:MAG: ABC transporter ATP-binding protein [Hyphomicrobiales bacterium]